jgi:hypothetical protein
VVRAGQVFEALARPAVLYYVSKMKSSNVIRNKPGRPRIGKEVADVFAVRLPSEITKAVEEYAKREAIKSRGEAIRRLVEIGLESAGKPAARASK